jgi:hypothetical protein
MNPDTSRITTQTPRRLRLQQMAREGRLMIETPDGIVNATSTASVWGEGDNVDGFRWATRGQAERGTLDAQQTDALLGEGMYEMAASWASDHADDE